MCAQYALLLESEVKKTILDTLLFNQKWGGPQALEPPLSRTSFTITLTLSSHTLLLATPCYQVLAYALPLVTVSLTQFQSQRPPPGMAARPQGYSDNGNYEDEHPRS